MVRVSWSDGVWSVAGISRLGSKAREGVMWKKVKRGQIPCFIILRVLGFVLLGLGINKRD